MQSLKRRLAQKKVTHQNRLHVCKPLQNLRKIALQQCRQPIADPGLITHQATPMLNQQTQCSSLFIIGRPRLETLSMLHQQLDQILGVTWIIPWHTTERRLRGIWLSLRVDRIEDQKVVL